MSSFLTAVISFVSFTIIGKKMSVEGYGVFSTSLALAKTVAPFVINVIAGIVINREIALNSSFARKLLRKTFVLRLLVTVVGTIFLSVYLFFFTDNAFAICLSIILLVVYESFWDLFEQIAFGLKQTKYTMILNSLFSSIWLVFVIICPSRIASTILVLIVYALIHLFKTIVYGLFDIKLTKREVAEESSCPGSKDLFKKSMPYFYIRCLGVVSTQVPILLLSWFSQISEVSYYSVGEKFTMPLTIFITTVVNAVFPYLTVMFKEKQQSTSRLVVKMFGLIMTISSCLALLLSATSMIWLPMIMGDKYSSAVEAFNYQIWFAVILSVDSLISMALSSNFKQKTLAIITTIDVVVLIPFLLLSLPFGAKGVAIAKLIAAGLCLIYHLVVLLKTGLHKFFDKSILIGTITFVLLFIVYEFTNSFMVAVNCCVAVMIINLIFQKDLLLDIKRAIIRRFKKHG